MDDSNIRGLSKEDAKAYVMEFLTALKLLEKELSSIATEINAWAGRIELAVSRGAAELESAARAKLSEYEAKQAALKDELTELNSKIVRLKEQLPMAGMSELSVDPDMLLAQLRMAAGLDPDDRTKAQEGSQDFSPKQDGLQLEKDTDSFGAAPKPEGYQLEKDIAALRADDALEALKKKISEGT